MVTVFMEDPGEQAVVSAKLIAKVLANSETV
jgi:hypothetical protein